MLLAGRAYAIGEVTVRRMPPPYTKANEATKTANTRATTTTRSSSPASTESYIFLWVFAEDGVRREINKVRIRA